MRSPFNVKLSRSQREKMYRAIWEARAAVRALADEIDGIPGKAPGKGTFSTMHGLQMQCDAFSALLGQHLRTVNEQPHDSPLFPPL